MGIDQKSSRELIQGVKKDRQSYYDDAFDIFGSNGTYVGYEEKYYVLKIKILRPSQENYEPFVYKINIEDFIRDYYLPKQQRQRMSSNLRDEINKKLNKLKRDVVTHDFDEDGAVSIDATYLPIDKESWEEFLKALV